jgi:hypothetical protein
MNKLNEQKFWMIGMMIAILTWGTYTTYYVVRHELQIRELQRIQQIGPVRNLLEQRPLW